MRCKLRNSALILQLREGERERASERTREREREKDKERTESFVVAIRTDVKNSTSNDGKMFLSWKHERKEVLTN